jgi:nicotinamidase/pyrazinamidase
LVVIDIQNDFCPGGALAVAEGNHIISGVNALAQQFAHVVVSQDWHPAGHASFASAQGREPYDQILMPYGPQTLWPDHCVQDSPGALFHLGLNPTVQRSFAIVRKGMNPAVDSYSAFFENDRTTSTGLAGLLRDRGIQRVFFVGLAYDFCVGFSALDANQAGFQAVVVRDHTRGIGAPVPADTEGGAPSDTITQMDHALAAAGITQIDSLAFSPTKRAPKV